MTELRTRLSSGGALLLATLLLATLLALSLPATVDFGIPAARRGGRATTASGR